MQGSVGVRVGVVGVILVGLAVAMLLLARMPVPEHVGFGETVVNVGAEPVPVDVEEVVGRELPRRGFMVVSVESNKTVTLVAVPGGVEAVEPGGKVTLGLADVIYVGCEGGCIVSLGIDVYKYTMPYSWLLFVAVPLGLLGVVMGFIGAVLVWLEAPWVKRRRRR